MIDSMRPMIREPFVGSLFDDYRLVETSNFHEAARALGEVLTGVAVDLRSVGAADFNFRLEALRISEITVAYAKGDCDFLATGRTGTGYLICLQTTGSSQEAVGHQVSRLESVAGQPG